MSTLSLIPEEKKYLPNTSKSTESLYSSSSSKYSASALYKRKITGVRQPGFITGQNEVRQRVLSARRLRMKTLQNQLVDAQQHIAELANENRILRTLHKRQDSALTKYEGTSAGLPQLLHSHAEEIRMWQTKYRNLQIQNKELTRRSKEKDSMLLSLGDQNKHLIQLSKDRNLEDRERLTERVRYLENRLSEKDNDLKLLARRLQLEAKNFRAQLSKEQNKYKQLIQKLEHARINIEKLTQLQFDSKESQLKAVKSRSLSGSKLPKPDRGRNRYPAARVRDNNNAMASLSTPSLCQEYQTIPPINEIKSGKLFNAVIVGDDKINSRDNKSGQISRQTSGARKSRRDDHNGIDSVDLSDAISKGMSKLLINNEAENNEASLNDNDDNSIKDDLLDQSEPENYYEDDDEEDDGNAEDYIGFDYNEESVEVIEGGKTHLSYESEEIVQQTRLEFANIQQQMSDDYMRRESFLDTFCRDSSNTDKDLSARRATNIDLRKKDQLLAALKAIDSEGVQ